MPEFSILSEVALKTCHPDIQTVIRTVIQVFDFKVLYGFRSNEKQQELFEAGLSKKKSGESKHNKVPSLAIDVAPFPIDWKDTERFCYLAGMIMMTAWELGILMRWGRDWNQNTIFKDESFLDYGHFELMGVKYDK